MLGKLIGILTGTLTKDQILERLLKNPKTTALGAIVASLAGSAYALHEKGLLIASGLCAGLAALLAVVGLVMAVDGPKPPEDPPPGAP